MQRLISICNEGIIQWHIDFEFDGEECHFKFERINSGNLEKEKPRGTFDSLLFYTLGTNPGTINARYVASPRHWELANAEGEWSSDRTSYSLRLSIDTPACFFDLPTGVIYRKESINPFRLELMGGGDAAGVTCQFNSACPISDDDDSAGYFGQPGWQTVLGAQELGQLEWFLSEGSSTNTPNTPSDIEFRNKHRQLYGFAKVHEHNEQAILSFFHSKRIQKASELPLADGTPGITTVQWEESTALEKILIGEDHERNRSSWATRVLVKSNGYHYEDIVAGWNTRSEETINAARMERPRNSLSFAHKLSTDPHMGNLHLRYAAPIIDSRTHKKSSDVAIQFQQVFYSKNADLDTLKLTSPGERENWETVLNYTGVKTALGPAQRGHDFLSGHKVDFQLLANEGPDQSSEVADATCFGLSFLSSESGIFQARILDGALGFELGAKYSDDQQITPCGWLKFRIVDRRSLRPLYPWHWDFQDGDAELVWELNRDFPIARVFPAGQDMSARDAFLGSEASGVASEGKGWASEPPLIINLDSPEENADASPYLLTVHESGGRDHNRRLEMELRERANMTDFLPAQASRTIVLDAEPALMVMVVSPPLKATQTGEESPVVATRSPLAADGDLWHVQNDEAWREGYLLVLPAQGLGEEAIKGDSYHEKGIDRLLDFRLSPPAILRFIPGPLERRFVNVAWNLRHHFGRAGDRDPGVGLNWADMELLYGLSLRATGRPVDVDAGYPEVRLAEIAAVIGDLPPPKIGSPERYVQFYRAWRRRPAVWETRKPLVNGSPLIDNVEYRIRVEKGTSDHSPKGAQLKFPLLEPDPELEKIEKAYHPQKENGLPGGATWGFESQAIYEELFRTPTRHFRKSSSGELSNFRLSSLAGGWGKQTARFASDKTIIQACTEARRTHVYAVERIGRIGVFWNKAKHVILYERATTPSKQFAADQKNNPFHGRPVLRKIAEYIEILEPERSYPDFPEGGNLCAFITACKFKSRIIPVHGSWGVDRRDMTPDMSGKRPLIGWEIPLWKAWEDPDIYPKPEILLEVMAEPETGSDRIHLSFEEPQHLRFYTDTRDTAIWHGKEIPITGDVHAWPPVAEVDYTNLPEPQLPNVMPGRNEAMDAPLPDGLAIAPGFERFTFRVTPSNRDANLVAHQNRGAVVNGRIQNISMQRCMPASPSRQAEVPDQPDLLTAAMDMHSAFTAGDKAILDEMGNGILATNRFRRVNPMDLKVEKAVTETDAATVKLKNADAQHKPDGQSAISELAGKWNRTFEDAYAEARKVVEKLEEEPKPGESGVFHDLWDKAAHDVWTSRDNSNILTLPCKWLWKEILIQASDFYTRGARVIDRERDKVLRILNQALQGVHSIHIGRLQREVKQMKENLTMARLVLPGVFDPVMELLDTGFGDLNQQVMDSVGEVFDRIDQEIVQVQLTYGGQVAAAEEIKTQITDAMDKALKWIEVTNNAPAFLDKWSQQYEIVAGQPPRIPADINTHIRHELATFKNKVESIFTNLMTAHESALNQATQEARSLVQQMRQETTALGMRYLSEAQTEVRKTLRGPLTGIAELADGILGQISGPIDKWVDEINAILNDSVSAQGDLADWIRELMKQVRGDDDKDREGNTTRKRYGAFDLKNDLKKVIRETLYQKHEPVNPANFKDETKSFFHAVLWLDIRVYLAKSWLFSLPLLDGIGDAVGFANQILGVMDSAGRLQHAIDKGDWTQVSREIERLAGQTHQELGKLAGEAMGFARQGLAVSESGRSLYQEGKQSLRTMRAFVDEFRADGLGFNRKTVALFLRTDWDHLDEQLGITPVLAQLKQFNGDLEALGIRLPTDFIGQQLIPSLKLDQFDFSKIFSDFGGMKFNKLFPGFKAPDWLRKHVKITHGIDKENMKAWVKATSSFKLEDGKILVSFGPLILRIRNGQFQAKIEMEVDIDGRVKQFGEGSIIGDWEVVIGSFELCIFKQTTLAYRDGKMDFDLDPRNVETPGVLKLLTDATRNLGGFMGQGEDGKDIFRILILSHHNVPTGLKAELEIPPIDVGGGVTALSNLQFGCFLSIAALDEDLHFDFEVAAGLHLSSLEKPFNLTIYFFGGGGYFDVAFRYKPDSGKMWLDVAVAVNASAAIAFNIGWLKGAVTVYLGFNGHLHREPDQHSTLSLTIHLIIDGTFELMSLVTIRLYVYLAMTYRSSGSRSELIGHGYIKVTIRITRFFKLKVRRDFDYTFAKSNGDEPSRKELATRLSVSTERVDDTITDMNRQLETLAQERLEAPSIEVTESRIYEPLKALRRQHIDALTF